MMTALLSFLLVDYIVPPILFLLLLLLISYYIWLVLRNRSEKQLIKAISIIKDRHQLRIKLLNDRKVSNSYQEDKKREIEVDLISFLRVANFKVKDDMQNAIMSILLLKQMTKAIELIASEEDLCRFAEYEALRSMAKNSVFSNLPDLEADVKSVLMLFREGMRGYLRGLRSRL